MSKKKNPNEMDLSEHVKELKHRVMIVLSIFIIVFIVAYLNCNSIMKICTDIGTKVGYEFVYLAPQEVIIQQFRIAGLTAFICDLPIIVYEVIAFIAPVFTNKQSFLNILILGIVALILFLVGALFAYEVLLPFIYKFLFDIGQTSKITAQISIKEYISLFITTETCIGVVTEMPLICVMLTKVGILTPNIMCKIRPYIIVIIFIVSAIITPPDVFSQMTVALPMVLLYQISIFICKFIKEDKNHGRSKTGK